MEAKKSQPQFWLEVREEYVIDNFDKLVQYLKRYDYDSANESAESDFEKSYNCLRHIADKIVDRLDKASIIEKPIFDISDQLAGRILGVTILAEKKRGFVDNKIIAALIHFLIIRGFVKHSYRRDLIKQLFYCINNAQPISLAIRWDDFIEQQSFESIAYKLAQTKWEPMSTDIAYFEGRGLVALSGNRLKISPMNFSKFTKTEYATEISTPFAIDYVVANADKSKGQVTSLAIIDRLRGYLRELSSMKPSPVVPKKEYSLSDELVVTVVRTIGIKIEAVSTDPRYNTISGNVHFDRSGELYYPEVYTAINVGDKLLVKIQSDSTVDRFIVDNDLQKKFYKFIAEYSIGDEFEAIYCGEYSVGTQWLTSTGLLVNIYENLLSDDDAESLQQAIDDKSTITIKIKDARPDKNKNFVINASYNSYDSPYKPNNRPSFRAEALKERISEYTIWSNNQLVKIDNQTSIPLDKYYLTVITNLLTILSDDSPNTIDRVKILAIATLIAYVRSCNPDVEYLMHKINYLAALINFANGNSIRSLTHPSLLNDITDISQQEDIINQLCSYQTEATRVDAETPDNNSTIDKISSLIEASNILRGKVNDGCISLIKSAIVDCLEVSDEYIPSCNSATYYGVENETLEFKSSIVFPPRNHQNGLTIEDSESQKWAILNAVCGFLNSANGGEILLGVKDNGYSCGINDDIQTLFNKGRINNRSADALRIYTKNIIDNAFKSAEGKAVKQDITALNVTIDILEANKEGHELLSIKVKPYKNSIIEYIEKNRPEWVAKSYIRTSGATLPLTDNLRKQLIDLRQHQAPSSPTA
jgi:hypothetical protein